MMDVLPAGPGNLESAPFFEAAREGRFLLRRSVTTKRAHWYPRAQCPFDGSETEWFEASGDADIFSFTIIPGAQPYVVAYVTLAEGPRMLTNLVDCDPATLSIGQKLRIVWRETSDESQLAACFTPIAG